jgi:hypothetical protein
VALKGRMAGRPRHEKPARSPERELLAAVILQALADALAGDAEAAAWMDFYAPDIAYYYSCSYVVE